MKKNLHVIIISFIFSVILWVSISLSNDYYATIEVPVKLTDFPSGYSTGSNIPDQVSVKLKGKGWKLIAVNLGSESNFQVPVREETGKRTVNLYNYLVDNQWLSSDIEVINIAPDTISFYVEKIISKKLPITANLNLHFKSGYGIATPIIISPDSTEVYGPESYLEKMKEVPTADVEFDNLDDKVNKIVSLKNIQGMNYSQDNVIINLDVQKIVDKNFDNVFVKPNDVPSDRQVILLPNRITVGVRGGIDILGKLDTSEFKAEVSYRQVVLDTLGSVLPKVEVPQNTSLLYTKPERLRYIIKKYN
jgi:YbbR domain-containing protein